MPLLQTLRAGPGRVLRAARFAKVSTGVDLSRAALLLLTASSLSTSGYVLLRRALGGTEIHVNTRSGGLEHTSTAKGTDPAAITLALDRAVQWLRAAQADARFDR